MPTANENFLDAMIRHQIGLQRFGGKVTKDAIALLDSTEKDLQAQILRRLPASGGITPGSVRRLQFLELVVRELRGEAWKDVGSLWGKELRNLSVANPNFIANAVRTVLPFPIELNIPSSQLLKSLVTTVPFEGKLLRDHVVTARRADAGRIMDQIRIGMVQGESNQAISKRVVGTRLLKGRDGVTQLARNNVEAITRTAVNHFSNQANREFFKDNERIFSGEVFVATLDSRTTFVCSRFDGERFKVGDGPIPPLHFRCRSTRVAVIDDTLVGERFAKPTTERILVSEFSKSRGIPNPTTRRNLPRGTKGEFDVFARKRTRELLGKVPAKVNFQEFLTRQSTAFQDEYLGITRARLFRKGGLTLKNYVNRAGDEIPLSALATTQRQAFINAGLDPDNFR